MLTSFFPGASLSERLFGFQINEEETGMNAINKCFVGTCIFLSLVTSGSYTQDNQEKKNNYVPPSKTLIFDFSPKSRLLDELRKREKIYRNTYKTRVGVSGITPDGYPVGKLTGGSTYSFSDKNGQSFYLVPKHTVMPSPLSVLVEKKRIVVCDLQNRCLEARIEELSKEHDFGIISTKEDNYKSRYVKTISWKDLIVGEDAYIPGYPMGRFQTVKKTNIAALIYARNKFYIVLDEKIYPHHSGSPVYVVRNKRLRLAGMITGRDLQIDVSYAIPSNYFKELLEKYR